MPKDETGAARHGTDWLKRLPNQANSETALEGMPVVIPDADMARLQNLLDLLAVPLAGYATLVVVEREQLEADLAEARALNNRLTKALAYLVKEWPQTSWAGSNDAHDTAQALLDELAGEGATMASPDPATVQ